jgi:amino acid permease
MIYSELEDQSEETMRKVLAIGSILTAVMYSVVGIFGYAIFPSPPSMYTLCSKNIIDADFGFNVAIEVGAFAMLISAASATPMTMLPSKDTIEELFFSHQEGGKMTNCQNFFVTVLLTAVCAILAVFIRSIGDAMTLVGSSVNPIVGFILPVLFYSKFIKDQKWYSKERC